MSRRSRRAALAAAALLLLAGSACGKKGPLLPPLRIVPQAAEDLRASQRGARVVLEWANPQSYNDGSPLPGIAAVEIWEGLEAGDFPDKARLVRSLAAADLEPLRIGAGPSSRALSFSFVPSGAAAPTGAQRFFALRVVDAKRRRGSELSAPVAVLYVPAPRPPSGLAAAVEETRIVLTWKPPLVNADGTTPAALGGYVVLRSEGGDAPRRLSEKPLTEPRFEDPDFAFGRTYRYIVRAVASAAASAESEDSDPLEIKPADAFPPAVPAGLSAAAGGSVITLFWEAGREPDLAGYRVWRREAGKDWVRLAADLIPGSAYTDSTAAPGVPYEYAVSAVDAAGNESARCAPAAAAWRTPDSHA